MVIIDGKEPKEFGMCVYETPIIPTPERDVVSVEIRGRNGTLNKKYGYNDIVLPITFNLLKREGIKPTIRSVKPWLMEADRIEFLDDPGFYYRVIHGELEDVENNLGMYGYFTCQFRCMPFVYRDLPTVSFGTSGTIQYNGTVPGEPYIKITGTGSGSLAVNSVVVANFVNVDGSIELDSESKQVFKGTEPAGNKMIGNFPVLQPGSNEITLSGGLTGFEIVVREGYL